MAVKAKISVYFTPEDNKIVKDALVRYKELRCKTYPAGAFVDILETDDEFPEILEYLCRLCHRKAERKEREEYCRLKAKYGEVNCP